MVAHELEVVGVHEDQHAVALDQAAQGAAHGLDDELAVGRDGSADGLLGDPQREVDGVGLDGGGGIGAHGLKLLGGAGKGGGGAVELALRLRDAGGEALLVGLLANRLQRGRRAVAGRDSGTMTASSGASSKGP